jgi:hypothetical protein
MSSSYTSTQETTQTESMNVRIGNRASGRSKSDQSDQLMLSQDGLNRTQACSQENSDEDKLPAKLLALKKLIEQLTGRKIHLVSTPRNSITANTASADQIGWGVDYRLEQTYQESQNASFTANGYIETADGRQISLTLEMNLSREYSSKETLTFRAGDAVKVDPLVINSGQAPIQLTENTVEFDLDSDGTSEEIHFVLPESGFLALDRNADGVINNGSELFGTQTGNGFNELAAYDEDGNNWIDENDAIFSKLLIWSKNPEGLDSLATLKDSQVGAIYLGQVGSSFDYKDDQNAITGQISAFGLYLSENGNPGSMQQVDLVV